ncbi:MAG: DUF4129 domain-containing protein [Rubrobacter sp.]|nr:DUF4129 domain-containing protein [Rubrobacter sp.]
MHGVASLDPASIIIAAFLLGGASLAFIYGHKRLALRRGRASLNLQRSVKASDARLYSRYKAITSAFEEAGVVREEHETPEEFSRRAAGELDEPGVARLGEIYLYARFRNAVPAEMAEEFGHLEPDALAAAERLKEASKAHA